MRFLKVVCQPVTEGRFAGFVLIRESVYDLIRVSAAMRRQQADDFVNGAAVRGAASATAVLPWPQIFERADREPVWGRAMAAAFNAGGTSAFLGLYAATLRDDLEP